MKRTAYVLAPLLLALAGFYAWHMPMRGPLTDVEIDRFLANQAETGGSVWTDEEAFETFLREDDGHPFVMINLMELRDVANYSEGSVAEARTGADAEAAYGRAVILLLLQRGSYPVARADRSHTIINSLGQSAAEFDSFAMVRYRSRRDLIDMLGSDAFIEAGVDKWASLENTLVAPASRLSSFNLIGYIPIFIFTCIAVVVTHALSRKG
ncbi:MAG: hypothetical protein AAGA50_21550 [Pseudomonadota bacterium]